MNKIELFPFQIEASNKISNRFLLYLDEKNLVYPPGPKNVQETPIPFFQFLSAVTAAGKTVILSYAIQQIVLELDPPPIILWISKAKVVVDQTYKNLQPKGKYNHLITPCEIRLIEDYDHDEAENLNKPIIYLATVGTFNQKDTEEGNRLNIHKLGKWQNLKDIKKPIIMVYDESQNLTDQQAELLLQLNPTGFFLASANKIELPSLLKEKISYLGSHYKSNELDWLITKVETKEVVDACLIKDGIQLKGYKNPMEITISSMLKDLEEAEKEISEYKLNFLPKAIYICNTNLVDGERVVGNDYKQEFSNRKAAPIRIWRYLVDKKIDPKEIAVVCDLKVDKDHPLPSIFNLFGGSSEFNYQKFMDGNYRHIIFNLSLQEGWDDPYVYFAYIDKSIGSKIKVEQIIGRLLRQPDATRFPSELLNTAHFYVRVDEKGTFDEVSTNIKKELINNTNIRFTEFEPGSSKTYKSLLPKEKLVIPRTAYDIKKGVGEQIKNILKELRDYKNDGKKYTQSLGSKRFIKQKIGKEGVEDIEDTKWINYQKSNSVTVRYLLRQKVKQEAPGALSFVDLTHESFSFKVDFNSIAHKEINRKVEEIKEIFLNNVSLVKRDTNPWIVGSIMVKEENLSRFNHALHKGYSGLNKFEEPFARKVDELGSLVQDIAFL